MVLLENALTRLPFPGVAAFYRALDRGATGAESNPIFYVSSSPWNLYDVIDGFLEAQRIPMGPLLLRDWDLGKLNERHASHKAVVIREIFDTYPELPFLLVTHGRKAVAQFERQSPLRRAVGRQSKAVYIRNVSANPNEGPDTGTRPRGSRRRLDARARRRYARRGGTPRCTAGSHRGRSMR
jgi:phosphatidate phosphatase APP1